MTENRLEGVRVFIIEDESLVSMLIEDMLVDLGCTVAGFASRCSEALAKSASLSFDAVILDVNLDGFPAYPIAEALGARGIPFVFVTGYGASGLPEAFHGVPVLAKPFRREDLRKTLELALAGKR